MSACDKTALWFKRAAVLTTVATVTVVLASCDREVTRIVSNEEPSTCASCHVSNDLITAKQTQWAESGHGMGEAYVRGTRSSCAGCHSGSAFSEMIAAGLNPGSVESGDPEPTRQDCRACHMIHETYTEADFALETEAPVTFYAMEGVTFRGGEGNLCVNCHQPRRVIPEPGEDGMITGITSHWGPHHGPQSSMLLGVGGAGVDDMVSGHYGAVVNTCVHCHMGDEKNHTFEPEVERCQGCHPDAENFDIEGVQTEMEALIDELGELLVARGLIDENSEDGHPIVRSAPEDEAIALWNWIYVAHEDKSKGVHNANYTRALLLEGLSRLE